MRARLSLFGLGVVIYGMLLISIKVLHWIFKLLLKMTE